MFRLRLLAAWLGLFLVIPGFAFGQAASISGRVIDANGESLPGANVLIEELTIGASTNADGVYVITVPARRVNGQEVTLVARFIGYQSQRRTITLSSGEQTQNFTMGEDLIGLEEVVVTALGIEREERSIGYSVQEVDGESLQRASESNLVNALAGKAAGVQVTSSSGQPGKASRITIRGISSMLGNNQPLFVIDGVPISNTEDEQPEEELALGSSLFTGGTTNRGIDIDPSIIEEINVLKGASATALYGSRAANGAIIITTKGGRTGQRAPRVTYSSTLRWDDAIIQGFQDQYLQGNNNCFANGLPIGQGGYMEDCYTGSSPQTIFSWGPHRDSLSAETMAALDELGVPLNVRNPRADFYQTGTVLENSLSLSGGGTSTNYFLSVGDLRQEGVVPGTNLDRTSLLAKFGAQLTNRLDVQSSVNFVRTNNDWLGEGNGAEAYLYSLNFTPINYDLRTFQNPDGTQRLYTTAALNNPFWLSENNRYTSNVDRFIASTNVSYDLLPWLSLSERVGIDTYGDRRKQQVNIGTQGQPRGGLYDQKITRTEINSDLTAQINARLAKNVSLDALVGNNINSRYYQFDFIRGENLGIPDFYNVSNASVVNGYEQTQEQRLISAFAQATLDYNDIAYLTLTGRNDWSSTLPEGNNSYFYPSVSLGLIFTEALSSVFDRTPLSFGKLRASVAQIGSDAPVYATSTTFVQANPGDGQRGNINYPYNGTNGYKITNVLGNPDLKPEISTEYEVGMDLRFFGQRARIDAAYYDRSTKDQIFNVPVSAATGFVRRLLNAGEIRNSGVELTLGLTPIETPDFAWDLQANFSKNTTKIVQLAEGVDNIRLAGFTSPSIRITPGSDGYGVIWGVGFQRNENGDLLIDDDGYPLLADALGPIGNVQPDWLGNLRTQMTFKGISLSALLDIRHGGDVLNFDQYYTVYYGTAEVTEQRGTPIVWDGVNATTGEPNTVEVLQDANYFRNFYSEVDELFVEDGSYVKLRELSLSYALPQSLLRAVGVQAASITATGRNLWIDSDFSYGDPEGSLVGSGNGQGFYHMVTPGTKSYSLGIRLTL